MKKITISLLPLIFLWVLTPSYAQTVADDPNTAMTVEATDAVIAPDDSTTNPDVAGDSNYQQREGPYAPELPDAGGNYEGPVGVTGIFNGNITTGCSYDPLGHSAHRVIDDIVVPGALGKYPLKMTRYYNSRQQYYAWGAIALSPGWAHEYSWLLWSAGHKVVSPHGNVYDDFCGAPVGVSEGWEQRTDTYNGTWRLDDGGKVIFVNGTATYIDDPYGLRTTITYSADGISRVTEPGGRYLQFSYGPASDPDGTLLLTRVEAHALGNATVTDWVNYSYTMVSAGVQGRNKTMLTRVDYSDGTSASYEYRTDNVTEGQTTHKMYPLLQRCDDVRYNGPMRTIRYEYQNDFPHGFIINEKYPGIGAPSAISVNGPDTFTETRGDGPTRSFTYSHIHHCQGNECGPCDDYGINGSHQQMLLSYTDFQGHTMTLGYDANSYVNSVTDANTHTTTYTRGPPPPNGIGQITRITHPGGAHIDYTYYDEDPQHIGVISGHYLQSVTDERGAYLCDPAHTTTYRRDGNYRVYRIEYPQDGNTPTSIEEFTYNNFGQVTRHKLRNGKYVHYQYNSRGLLLYKWNPTTNATAQSDDPKTTYSYWTNAAWADRVYQMTLPANVSNQVAYERYEYDRNASGAACPGRGLVTKITHADGKYQSFGYNQFGNKMWEENELRQRTSYTSDNYNRVFTITKPLSGAETFSYLKPGTASPYLHTTNSVYTHTSGTGIVTTNVYDPNWRKTSTTEASGTLNLTTRFAYDHVGNLTDVTDPRLKTTHNGYDNRNRKTSTTEAYGITGLAATTAWHYNVVGSIFQIDRPDGVHETKGYDALNRVIWHTVPRQVVGGGQVNVNTRIFYNPSGTIQKVRDANWRETNFDYDPSDRKITMRYPGGTQSQSWAYDDAGNLKNRTTVSGKIQSFDYDNRNRKIGMRWSNVADWATYGYDYASRLTNANNPNSSVTRTYDAAGRLTQDQQYVTGLGIKTVSYPLYDNDGKLKQLSAAGVYDYTFGYDAAGRFETISSGGSKKFEYDYDPASNETHRHAYFNGNTIDQIYNRDSLNRMASRVLKKNGATIAGTTESYTYDHMNRLTEVTRGNLADDFNYYWTGELLSAHYGGSPNLPFTEGQEPDLDTADTVDPNAGYQPPETEEAEPPPPADDTPPSDVTSNTAPAPRFTPSDTPPAEDPAKEQKTVEDYLGDGKLAPDGPEQPDLPTGRNVIYTLDKAGNRTSVTDNVNGNAIYAPNNLNQYTSVGGSSLSNGPEHEIQTYYSVTYSYINDEHLKTVSSGSNTYNLYYDALGRCVKRSLNRMTTYYIYDGEKPILEYRSGDLSHPAKNVYGKGIDEILMRFDPSFNPDVTYYYQQDHEGSVTHLLNTSGNVIESYKYDAFGAPAIYAANGTQLSSSAYSNRFLFTGREYANLFGFYEYRARAYHPILGRFMSEDPKGFVRRAGLGKGPDDWTFGAHSDEVEFNLFRYCGNDPVDFSDPMGLDTMANAMAVAEAVVPGQYEYNQMVASFQSGNYGNATGWGVTWVSSAVVGVLSGTTSTRAQAGFRAARAAVAEGKAISRTGYRYVGAKEARTISREGTIPLVDQKNRPKTVFYTDEKFTTGKAAKTGLDLDSKPTHRVEFSMDHAAAGSGRLTDHGRVEFTLREGAEPIRANKLTLLNDAAAELVDMASRHVPAKLDR
jgi:RHS repeat-associated protein